MGFFSSDMEPMIDIYQRETVELLDEWEQRLLDAMQHGTISRKDIDSFFRVAHTIKSSSAMMGMSDMSKYSHRLEDLFLLFRDKPEQVTGNENRILDMLYVYADYVLAEIYKITDEGYKPASADSLLKILESEVLFFQGKTDKKTEPTQEKAAQKPVESKKWKIFFKKDCQMENARAFMLVKQIKPLCTEISYVPSDLEKEDAAEHIRRDGLLLSLQTEQPDTVLKKLLSSPYLEKMEDRNEGEKKKQTLVHEDVEEEKTVVTSRFVTIPWTQMEKLREISLELATAGTMLESALERGTITGDLEELILGNKRVLADLEELVREASLIPVSSIMPQYYRIVRDISRGEGKDAVFKVSGEEIRVEKSLLDSMIKPLIHMIRNAVDHGIESPQERQSAGKEPAGRIGLAVEVLGGSVRFTVEDDGRGMDTEIILKKAEEKNLLVKKPSLYTEQEILNLIFIPGFSTMTKTTEFSGRGVGMDVVQHMVDSLGGVIHLESTKGKGSRFIIDVPISVTSQECILFQAGRLQCLLPMKNIEYIHAYENIKEQLSSLNGNLWFQSDTLVPVLDLSALFAEEKEQEQRLIIVQGIGHTIALLTGNVLDRQTAVEKPLPPFFGQNYRLRFGISGCSVLGDGSLGFMLNPEWLIRIQQGMKKDAGAENGK